MTAERRLELVERQHDCAACAAGIAEARALDANILDALRVGAAVYIVGNFIDQPPVHERLRPADVTVTLASDFSAAAKVGVSVAGVDSTTETQTTFATSATDFSKCFTADADGVVTAYVAPAEGETEGKLVLKKYQHLHPIGGDASCEEADHQIGEWTAWDGTGTIPTEGNVYLTANVTLTANLKPASGKTLNLCLNGYQLTRSNGRPINASGGTLTICDCAERAETGTIYGTVAGELGGLAIVQSSGKFVLYSGT